MVRVGVYRHAIMKSHHMRVILVGLFSGEFSVCASVRPGTFRRDNTHTRIAQRAGL